MIKVFMPGPRQWMRCDWTWLRVWMAWCWMNVPEPPLDRVDVWFEVER